MDDVSRLREALAPVERSARQLPWAKQRPWKVSTHVGYDAEVPTIDLHDLGARTADLALDQVLAMAHELDAGAVCFVTGRGRHSMGEPVLPGLVNDRLSRAAHEAGWQVTRPRAGRFTLILDGKRAPASATGALGCGFRLWLLFVAAASLVAAVRSCR